jgi:hypothetical protein
VSRLPVGVGLLAVSLHGVKGAAPVQLLVFFIFFSLFFRNPISGRQVEVGRVNNKKHEHNKGVLHVYPGILPIFYFFIDFWYWFQ